MFGNKRRGGSLAPLTLTGFAVSLILPLHGTRACQYWYAGLRRATAPGDGFVRLCATVATIKLLPCVDEHGIVCAIPLQVRGQYHSVAWWGTPRRSSLTIRLALHVWCLHRPPPMMSMPLFLACKAKSLMALISTERRARARYSQVY